MECDNAYNSNDDFEDREEATVSNDGENVRSSSSTIGSPHSVFTSSDSQELTASASSSNKVLGHNYNGTAVFTNTPRNEAELQLYRVMQRASLLSYYDTLLEMGGDDVQQLCDAGEEEFLEIMALVGMASKPLHVRRFQKALQEWLTNPLMFQIPLTNVSTSNRTLTRPLSVHNVSSSPMSCSNSLTNTTPVSSPSSAPLQQLGEISSCTSAAASSPVHGSISSLSSSPCPTSPVHAQNSSQPVLDEQQIKKLEKAAARLAENLPELEPKYPNTKKKVGKELQAVLNMSDDDPLRMQHIRKFSAIYGRFDCKRKPEKPLTLHEVSVNEAAAQICKHIPALLTRRDELFPLARQVVRDSGYQYSKGHSKSFAANNLTKSAPLMNTFKFHDNFSKRKNSIENAVSVSYKGLIENEEKLKSVQMEILKVTSHIEQLTSEIQNISEEACEFSALKYQLEAFKRTKLQLLEEYTMLSNHTNIPKKRGRKCKNYLAFNFEKASNDDDNLADFNGEEIENSNDSQNYDDEDTKSSEMTYIQDVCSEKEENGELESMHEEYDRIGEHKGESRRKEILDEFDEKNFKERLIADEKLQVVACKGDNIIAVTNPALRLCMAADTNLLLSSVKLKQERTSPIEFE